MERRRVLVVGRGGVVTPLGNSVPAMWDNLLAGKVGTGMNTFTSYLEAFDEQDERPAEQQRLLQDEYYKDSIAAEVRGFDPRKWMSHRGARRADRFTQFAIAAAQQAMQDTGLVLTDSIRDRGAVIIGTGMGGLITIEHQHIVLRDRGARRVTPLLVSRIMLNGATGAVARLFGFHAPSSTPVSACATGADAIGQAFWLIQRGKADIVIAGGSEAVITPLALAGFENMGALTKPIGSPEQSSRPFDVKRKGFMMGEGAGVVVLVSASFADEHGLTPSAELAGYGCSQDAYHDTAPHPDGTHLEEAIRAALREANVASGEIVYINPHGTGTPLNDRIEAKVLRAVFGQRAESIAMSSSKGPLAHLLGAAGAVEFIVCLETLRSGQAHPAANLYDVDPECSGLGHIIGGPRSIASGAVLSNSSGFGGGNAALVLKPV